MERRNLLAGLIVLVVGVFMLTGTALARTTHHKKIRPAVTGTTPAAETPACTVHTLPSFMDQGEFSTASSVGDIVEVECYPEYAEQDVTLGATELYNRCDKKLYWRTPYTKESYEFTTGPTFTVKLDNEGAATALLLGGPSCAAGGSLISAHLDVPPFSTVTEEFTVLPPEVTTEGVKVQPNPVIEGENYSDFAAIVQVEFPPVFAEEPVNITGSQVYSRCHNYPYTEAIVMGSDGEPYVETDLEEGTVYLDNDGNAFAIIVGNSSCAAGESLIEASLEHAPYTTRTTQFTIEPPHPTYPNPNPGTAG